MEMESNNNRVYSSFSEVHIKRKMELIYGLTSAGDLELCAKWLDRFGNIVQEETRARDYLLVKMMRQLQETGRFSLPFTDLANCSLDLRLLRPVPPSVPPKPVKRCNLEDGCRLDMPVMLWEPHQSKSPPLRPVNAARRVRVPVPSPDLCRQQEILERRERDRLERERRDRERDRQRVLRAEHQQLDRQRLEMARQLREQQFRELQLKVKERRDHERYLLDKKRQEEQRLREQYSPLNIQKDRLRWQRLHRERRLKERIDRQERSRRLHEDAEQATNIEQLGQVHPCSEEAINAVSDQQLKLRAENVKQKIVAYEHLKEYHRERAQAERERQRRKRMERDEEEKRRELADAKRRMQLEKAEEEQKFQEEERERARQMTRREEFKKRAAAEELRRKEREEEVQRRIREQELLNERLKLREEKNRKEREESEKIKREREERETIERERQKIERKERKKIKREERKKIEREELEKIEREELEKIEREELENIEREELEQIEREELEKIEREELEKIEREELEKIEREESEKIEREEFKRKYVKQLTQHRQEMEVIERKANDQVKQLKKMTEELESELQEALEREIRQKKDLTRKIYKLQEKERLGSEDLERKALEQQEECDKIAKEDILKENKLLEKLQQDNKIREELESKVIDEIQIDKAQQENKEEDDQGEQENNKEHQRNISEDNGRKKKYTEKKLQKTREIEINQNEQPSQEPSNEMGLQQDHDLQAIHKASMNQETEDVYVEEELPEDINCQSTSRTENLQPENRAENPQQSDSDSYNPQDQYREIHILLKKLQEEKDSLNVLLRERCQKLEEGRLEAGNQYIYEPEHVQFSRRVSEHTALSSLSWRKAQADWHCTNTKGIKDERLRNIEGELENERRMRQERTEADPMKHPSKTQRPPSSSLEYFQPGSSRTRSERLARFIGSEEETEDDVISIQDSPPAPYGNPEQRKEYVNYVRHRVTEWRKTLPKKSKPDEMSKTIAGGEPKTGQLAMIQSATQLIKLIQDDVASLTNTQEETFDSVEMIKCQETEGKIGPPGSIFQTLLRPLLLSNKEIFNHLLETVTILDNQLEGHIVKILKRTPARQDVRELRWQADVLLEQQRQEQKSPHATNEQTLRQWKRLAKNTLLLLRDLFREYCDVGSTLVNNTLKTIEQLYSDTLYKKTD